MSSSTFHMDGIFVKAALPGLRLAHALPHQFICVIERFQGQLFLAGEVVIDAPFLRPGLAHNVGERCASVSLAIKELSRVRQYLFARLFSIRNTFSENESYTVELLCIYYKRRKISLCYAP